MRQFFFPLFAGFFVRIKLVMSENKINIDRRYLAMLLSVCIYVSGLVAFVYFRSLGVEQDYLKNLDSRLYVAAVALKYILPEDFHDRVVASDSIDFDEEMKHRQEFYQFSKDVGLPYVYTLIERDGVYYFSAPTVTPEESKQRKRWYFYPYESIPEGFKKAYLEQKVSYHTYGDRWGKFRSVAIPATSPNGSKYLLCADCLQEDIENVIRESYFDSFLASLFFLLLVFPIFSLLFHTMRRLTNTNEHLQESKNKLEDEVAKRTSELNSANTELIKNRQQLMLALKTGKITVFRWDLKAETIEFLQTKMEDWKNFESKKLGIKLFKRCIHNDDRDEVMQKLAKYIAGSSDEFVSDFRIRFLHGKLRWFHVIGKILERSSTGIGSSMVGIVEDITEMKNKESALQQSQKLEAVGLLAGGIAHDFNNMLQAIIGYAEMIKFSVDEADENYDCIGLLLEAAQKSQALVSQLMTFSRMSHEIRENLNVNSELNSALKMVSRIIGGGVELQKELADGLPYVSADKGQLEQIIINLIVNSRDAIEGNGKVIISTQSVEFVESFCIENSWAKPGKYVKISIEDDGPGIEKDKRSKVFDPFFTTKEVGKGTGLGLAIVYSVANKHNGFVHIEESRFGGAQFDVYLPVSQLTSELRARTDEEAIEAFEGTETVLLAEDSELVRNFAGRMLRKSGYEVIFAVDGTEAVEKFVEHQDEIDILVFDIIMPGQTGKVAYEEIKKYAPNIPVVFCSGYHEEILDTKFFSNFNGTFLAKPYRSSDLLGRIRAILDMEKKMDESQNS